MTIHRMPLLMALKRIVIATIWFVLFSNGVDQVSVRAEATTVITFTCCAYAPATIFISVDDTVRWQGDFSLHPLVSEDELWLTQSTGMEFSYTFLTAGSYRFYCAIHGGPAGIGMSGQVIVLGPETVFMPLVTK